jgi:outer membrane protein assembly factor BamB/orotate phosphoribosyltransferase
MSIKNNESVLQTFIRTNGILRSSKDKIYRNPRGKPSSWTFDLRPALLNGPCLRDIAKQFWDIYTGVEFQLAGLELAGVPLAAALVMEGQNRGIDVSALIVRIKRKKYAGEKIIEGEINGKPVIMVDDAINSGGSAELGRKKLEAHGCKVIGLFCLVDFKSKAGVKWRARNKIEVISLFKLEDFGLTLKLEHTPETNYETIWSFASPRPKINLAVPKSTPVIFKNLLIFGSDCGTMWGVDKEVGRIEWQFKVVDTTGKGIVSSPVLQNGRVYFGAYDGTLYCLNAETGAKIWANKCCDWIGSSPFIHNNRIYIGLEHKNKNNGGSISCFDMNGESIWNKYLKTVLHSSPIVHDYEGLSYVITGTNDSDLYTLNPQTGDVISHVKTEGPTKYHCAAWQDKAVACAFDAIYVWDYRTGEVLFRLPTEDINYSRPLIVGNLAFCGSADHTLYVINLESMEVVYELNVSEKIHSSPALIDGLVWFGTSAGQLIGLDPVNFEVLNCYAFPERLVCTPVSDGNKLFVYSFDNRMWAIKHLPS